MRHASTSQMFETQQMVEKYRDEQWLTMVNRRISRDRCVEWMTAEQKARYDAIVRRENEEMAEETLDETLERLDAGTMGVVERVTGITPEQELKTLERELRIDELLKHR